jgi:intermediate peptidase
MSCDSIVLADLSPEERMVASTLLDDFKRCGVHMNQQDREHFVKLSDDITALGNAFSSHAHRAMETICFSVQRLEKSGISRETLSRLHSASWRGGSVSFPSTPSNVNLLLRTCHDESVRKSLFCASYADEPTTSSLLSSLLKKRGELARLVGFPNYATFFLSDKLLSTPKKVGHFLDAAHQ